MNELYTHSSFVGFSHLEYRGKGRIWGWFTLECIPIATHFIFYKENGLAFAIPYAVFCDGCLCVYTDNYCIGQVNLSGTISEAYKWEERLIHHGFSPEFVSRIHDYLQKVKK